MFLRLLGRPRPQAAGRAAVGPRNQARQV